MYPKFKTLNRPYSVETYWIREFKGQPWLKISEEDMIEIKYQPEPEVVKRRINWGLVLPMIILITYFTGIIYYFGVS